METYNSLSSNNIRAEVLSLPMRDGNSAIMYASAFTPSVLSLPMRDGNDIPLDGPWCGRSVLSLPMRDGNLGGGLLSPPPKRLFLAYL